MHLGFVRARMAEPAGVTDEFWAKLAEQGWLGLVYPEEYGGSGLGFVDLTVLMEEMGRVVMPGPFFSTVLLGGLPILEAGSAAQKKEWLAQIAAGQAKATLAWTEPSARWDAAGVTTHGARAGPAASSLNGTKLFVLDAHLADVLVVVARTREGKQPEEGIEPVPGAQGHARARGEAAADDGPDAQALRGDVRATSRVAGRRAARAGEAAGRRSRA